MVFQGVGAVMVRTSNKALKNSRGVAVVEYALLLSVIGIMTLNFSFLSTLFTDSQGNFNQMRARNLGDSGGGGGNLVGGGTEGTVDGDDVSGFPGDDAGDGTGGGGFFYSAP